MVASNIDSYNAIAYLQQGRLWGMKPVGWFIICGTG